MEKREATRTKPNADKTSIIRRGSLRLLSLPYQRQRFFFGLDRAIELGVFHGGQQFFEIWSRLIAGLDQVVAGEQRLWTDLLGGHAVEFFLGEVIERQVAMAALAIQTMELQMLIKLGQAQEAFQRGFFHAHDVAKAHVVRD